jgi:hypothetical protein
MGSSGDLSATGTWATRGIRESLLQVEPHKLNVVESHSLKSPDFNPCAYEVNNRLQDSVYLQLESA